MMFPENFMGNWQFLKIIGEFDRTKSRFPPNFLNLNCCFDLGTSCFDGKKPSFLMMATSNKKHKDL